MPGFIDQVVDDLLSDSALDVGRLCFVLPNKRAGLFLKNSLAQRSKNARLAPTILPMESLVEQLAGVKVLEPVTLLFEFYNHFRLVEGPEAPPLEEFVRWAPQLLADFNEVDSHLVRADKLFGYVNESRALELWTVDGSPLSDTQQQYLKFWESLNKYYTSFTTYLNQEAMAYEGLAARWAVDVVQKKLEKNELQPLEAHHDKLVFVGFNGLTPAEESIIRAYKKAGLAITYWDTDEWYMANKQQEAGHFLRQYREGWAFAKFKWIGKQLAEQHRSIDLIGVASHVGQTKVAGELLEGLETASEFQDTAVVLVNESLLIPALQSLPEQVSAVNVTMGYPLKNAPLHGLLNTVFQLHENASRMGMRKGKPHFYHRDLVKLLSHPFLQHVRGCPALAERIITGIRKNNRVFLSREDLEELAVEEQAAFSKISALFSTWKDDPLAALESFQTLMQQLRHELEPSDQAESKQQAIDLEYLFLYHKIVKRLRALIGSYGTIQSLKTLRAVFNQLIAAQALPFYGEPLKGLQVMGLLETRLLDFDHVIMLSCNEDKLPAGKSQQTFIPFDIRREFDLPTHQERDARAAYHFYRLLHRCKKAWLLYNTEPDEMGGGEKSRFLTQIEHEFAHTNTTLQSKLMTFPVVPDLQQETLIQKTPEVLKAIDALMEKGLSPSALNRFINCPLDFYYKYIIGLRDEEEVEETIEATTLGSFVHQVLEDLYTPFLGKVVTVQDVEQMMTEAPGRTRQEFLKKFRPRDLDRGKNLLTLKVAIKFVITFLKTEQQLIRRLEKKGEHLTILSLEQQLEKTINVGPHAVKLIGLADRIDRAGDEVRVIDYKTGMVKPAELKVADLSILEHEPAKAKAFQLLTYALLHRHVNGMEEGGMASGIISFRKLSSGFMNVQIGKSRHIAGQDLDGFEELVHAVIERIYDPKEPFAHDPDSVFCKFCGI